MTRLAQEVAEAHHFAYHDRLTRLPEINGQEGAAVAEKTRAHLVAPYVFDVQVITVSAQPYTGSTGNIQ